ncbi:hypothetical protein [Persephonella sp.]
MGLYDRDYMRERDKRPSPYKTDENKKLIIIAVISFILGFIAGKII